MMTAIRNRIARHRCYRSVKHIDWTERAIVMRTIGLIGGMSWESTAVYYRRLNEQVRAELGGLHSADIVAVLSTAMVLRAIWKGAVLVAF